MSQSGGDRLAQWVSSPSRVLVAVTVLLVVTVSVRGVKDRQYPSRTPVTQILYVPSAPVLDRLALSFDSLLADVYWIRALQHYGGARQTAEPEKNYDLLYPLLDITTTLDPRFNIAYRFGAIFLTEAYPDGPGRPDQAIALLQKGVRHMPGRWEYLMDIGFVYYWWLHEYEEAARWFHRASEVPGAPWWLGSLAANTLAEGGNRRDSRRLWQQIHDTADDEWLRRETRRRLLQLDALDAIEAIQAELERVAARHGRWPRGWDDVPDGSRLTVPPLDPSGYPYRLDPGSRTVTVSAESPLWPLPDEPPGSMAP